MIWAPLILIGTILEGELTLLVACLGAIYGDLLLVPIALLGSVGAFLGDWLFFELGRRNGEALLRRFRWLRGRFDRFAELLAKKPVLTLFILRYQIGMRMVGNFLLGSSEIDRRRYLELNAIACLSWGIAITVIGYWFFILTAPLWEMVFAAWS